LLNVLTAEEQIEISNSTTFGGIKFGGLRKATFSFLKTSLHPF
jgi:hypothetical protein